MPRFTALIAALAMTVSLTALTGCEKQPPAPPPDVPEAPEAPPTAPPAPEVPTGEDVKREVGEAAKVTGQYTAAKSKEFVEAARVKLAEWDQQLDALAEKTKDKSKSTWETMKLQYEQKKAAAAQKLAELKEAGGESWESAKTKANEALDEAAKSYEAVRKKLLEDEAPAEPPITTEQ